jgi:putative ABC transport system substrate-binding protein
VAAVAALLAVPQIGIAQPKVWRVGYISSGRGVDSMLEELQQGMRELGYSEGRNLVIERRFADGRYDRLSALADDLVARRMDVIVVSGTPAVQAVRRATSAIPIVMTTVGDPVASGFVASLARPGGNITGLSLANSDLSAKWFELARNIAPQPRIGVLADSNQETARRYVKAIQGAARKAGVKVQVAYAPTANEIESAFASLAQGHVATVVVLPSGFFLANARRIAQVALKRRMAMVATSKLYAESGALLSYGQNYGVFSRKAATYVDKILKGAKPGELPIEQPTNIELVINLSTARQLGLSIPKEMLLSANKVID